jgi:hypothetical protein
MLQAEMQIGYGLPLDDHAEPEVVVASGKTRERDLDSGCS